MKRALAYSAKKDDLFHPELGRTILVAGMQPAIEALCVEFSRLSYKHFESDPNAKQEIQAALALVGYTITEFFSVTLAHAFCASNPVDQTTIVAFRGTQPKEPDIDTDIDFIPTDWTPGGRVHSGFAEALLEIWKSGMSAWISARREETLVFTGHSLGAALATLASTKITPKRLVTIGSPRVGDSAFCALFNKPETPIAITRYVDCCDVVTRVPPEGPDYQHVGNPQYIDRFGVNRGNATDGEIFRDRLAARVNYAVEYGWKPGNNWVRGLADHTPLNYVYSSFAMTNYE